MSESTCPHCQHLTAVEAQIGERQLHPQMIIPISLRDWLAGMALQGQASFEGMEGCNKEQWVGMAYELADAMIERRKLP